MPDERYKISSEQVRSTGDILGIAVVERLDRIVELLVERLLAAGETPPREETASE